MTLLQFYIYVSTKDFTYSAIVFCTGYFLVGLNKKSDDKTFNRYKKRTQKRSFFKYLA